MSKIFVQSTKSANWKSSSYHKEDHAASPNLHWCYLVDQTEHDSKGLSIGQLKIPVGHSLAPHRDAQQEIYYILKGWGAVAGRWRNSEKPEPWRCSLHSAKCAAWAEECR